MAVKREYSAGKFMIEIEGVSVGFLLAVEGGEPVASVLSESDAVGDPVRKHLGSVTYDPIRMSFGAGMGAPLYQWMTDWLTGEQPIRSGAIVFLDYNFKERSRLEFDKASITEVEFPAVDAASREEGFFSVSLQPQVTRSNTASAGAVKSSFGGRSRKLTQASFSLKIGNLPVLRVNKIDLLTVKGPLARGEVRGLRIPNLAFTLPEGDAKEWFDW